MGTKRLRVTIDSPLEVAYDEIKGFWLVRAANMRHIMGTTDKKEDIANTMIAAAQQAYALNVCGGKAEVYDPDEPTRTITPCTATKQVGPLTLTCADPDSEHAKLANTPHADQGVEWRTEPIETAQSIKL